MGLHVTLPVLIKTYARDAEWLYWLLRSADKFARGFGPWHIVTEPESMEAVSGAIAHAIDPHGSPLCKIVDSHEVWPEGKSVLHHARGGNPGYFHQQGIKLYADLITGGDCLVLDSDCFFVEPTTPDDFGNPPYWMRTPYAELGGAVPWRKPTEEHLGFPISHEYMRRHPFLLRAEAVRGVRQHLELRTGHTLARLVAETECLSEFNLIGAWTARHAPHLYTWLDTAEVPAAAWPPVKVWQGWSYAGHGADGIPEETLTRYRELLDPH